MSVPLLEPVVTDTPRLRVSSPMFDIANRSMNFFFKRLTTFWLALLFPMSSTERVEIDKVPLRLFVSSYGFEAAGVKANAKEC